MTLEEFYKNLENPLEKDNIIDEILDAYTTPGRFYDNLVKYNVKDEDFVYALTKDNKNQKIIGYFFMKIADALYRYIFNEWKNSIRYVAYFAPNNHPDKQDAITLYPFIKDKNPQTKEEVLKIMNTSNSIDENTKKAKENLRIDKLDSAWTYFRSKDIYVSGNRYNINHRLYINCDSCVIYPIMFEFIKKCKERNLQFCCKFDEWATRDDVIVIYSSTDNLIPYIEILEEIKKETHLDNFIHEPTLLTARVNNWIGYGTEPIETGKMSYNSLRIQHLDKCIHQEVGRTMKNILSNNITYNGIKTTYYNYLINQILEEIAFSSYEHNTRQLILNEIKSRFTDILNYFENNNSFKEIVIKNNNKTIYITSFTLDKVFKKQVSKFREVIPNFNESLKQRIKNTSINYGVSKNYCVDTYIENVFKPTTSKEKIRVEQTIPKDKLNVKQEVPKKKIKVKQKVREWTPMTDEEIKESRRRLGL